MAYLKACGKATGRAAVTGATIVVTGGVGVASASMGSVTCAVTSAATGGIMGAGGAAACAALNDEAIKPGDVVGAGLLGAGGGAISGRKIAKLRKTNRIYRVMPASEGDAAVKNQKFSHGFKQGGPKGETCFSESTSHSRTYLPDKMKKQPELDYKCYQGKVDNSFLMEVKSNSIHQQGSKQINKLQIDEGKAPFNIRNIERLENHPSGKVNLLIKGPENLAEFNDHVQKIKQINPHSLKHRVPCAKHIARTWKTGSAAIIIKEGATNDADDLSQL